VSSMFCERWSDAVPERKQAETIEGRLADMMETSEAVRSLFSEEERMLIVKCLRDRARWMASDIYAGERPGKRQRR
jgi:hypothetical protein